ncbi:hypothetical protein GOP47_0017997 [Adiantum capillus-veneris]|uniref:Uncharacterized protein n=1 Tax=Adiantum capillus-veneris TaxID=13818 RepID=A0A9D4UHF0_ADICA|nr:hypothetical protein GOP47_0017997 [Adiantum capillus-veneris]
MESREKLDQKARAREMVVPGGTGGKTLEAKERLAEGSSREGRHKKSKWGQKDTTKWERRVGSPTWSSLAVR